MLILILINIDIDIDVDIDGDIDGDILLMVIVFSRLGCHACKARMMKPCFPLAGPSRNKRTLASPVKLIEH
jgi:hypothetical protein